MSISSEILSTLAPAKSACNRPIMPMTFSLLAIGLLASSTVARATNQYTPIINPHSQYYISIEGNVDPLMVKQFQLHWSAHYATHNPQCNSTHNPYLSVQAILFERHKTKHYATSIQVSGHFLLKIPLQAYQPGYCRWYLSGISYSFNYGAFTKKATMISSVTFSLTPHSPLITLIDQTWKCQLQQCHLAQDHNPEGRLSLQSNSRFSLTFTGATH